MEEAGLIFDCRHIILSFSLLSYFAFFPMLSKWSLLTLYLSCHMGVVGITEQPFTPPGKNFGTLEYEVVWALEPVWMFFGEEEYPFLVMWFENAASSSL